MTTAMDMKRFLELVPVEPVPEFRISILYESQALGAAAMKVCERLMQRFQDAFLFRIALERFQSLDAEERFNASLEAAEGANMIFVSSAGSLPRSFLRWLKQCLAQRPKDSPMALVEMTAGHGAAAVEVHRFLKDTAEANHLDLISKEQIDHGNLMTLCRHHSRAKNFRYWGINE